MKTEVIVSEHKEPASGTADEVAAQAVEGMLGPNPFIGLRPQDVLATVQQVGTQAAKQPGLVLEQEAALARELIAVLSGKGKTELPPGDKRFLDSSWRDNPFYRMTLQGYLAWGKALSGFVERSALDAKTKERANFVVGLLTDALAPTNTLLGNPAALKKIIDSGGASLLAGLQNMLADLGANRGMPAQVDKQAFRVGENLAVTPGAVVFRNEVLELIQYTPTTPEVYARPQLFVPPQINKYYAFDLSPGKSLVEYLVSGGFQVFMVSWRNPTAAQRHWDMDTYVAALLEAISAIRDITGSEDVNVHGACSGAMTMSALLGHLAAKGEKRVNAATLMVAVLDSTTDSQLGLFATPEAIAAAKHGSSLKGVLEGEEMGRVFAWMRPNDLVWNYWVNNYLMGNPPHLRHPVLEQRQHAPGGELPRPVARHLHRQPIHPGWRAIDPGHAHRPFPGGLRQVRGRRGDRSHHAVEGRLQHRPQLRWRYRIRADLQRPRSEPDQRARQSQGEVLPQCRPAV